LASGGDLTIDYRVVLRPERIRWLRQRGRHVVAKQGMPRRLRGVLLDIDEQKRTERQLRARERHLESILATVPDAMIVIDNRGIMHCSAPPRSGCSAWNPLRPSGAMSQC
jgi:two-component system, LuxR family, sensor kinase FixL